MDFVYLVGPPGCGKSTVMSALTASAVWLEEWSPFAHVRYLGDDGACYGLQLGPRQGRADFPGTDGLSMSVAPLASRFVRSRPAPLLLAEGDRLANQKFLDAVVAAGYTLHLVSLEAPEEVAARRRAERGGNQDSAWVRGRQTKVRNLLARNPHTTVAVDGQSPAEIAAQLRSQIPALEVLS